MADWITFILGRPGVEITFDVNPEAIEIDEGPVAVRHMNLAGDLKKSVIKSSAPVIRINSSYLTLAQRNQFASLARVADTFLSFQTRDDWEVVDELATVVDSTHVRIANCSATRLSAILTADGNPSIITIQTPFYISLGNLYGQGGYGGGGYGGDVSFDPGTITYDDATRTIAFTNPLADTTATVYVSYLYKGWLVDVERFGNQGQGGWLSRFKYDFQLKGA